MRLYESQLLYLEVEELDLLASKAGLELKERLADWNGSQHVSGATQDISIYKRGPAAV